MPNTGPVQERLDDARVAVLQEKEMVKALFAVDGALTKTTGIKGLTKGSAGAYTLAAPTAAEEGAEIVVVSQSAFAHVVTATGLLDNGTTGGSKTTATFAAFVGANMRLIAVNLKWVVQSATAVTVT